MKIFQATVIGIRKGKKKDSNDVWEMAYLTYDDTNTEGLASGAAFVPQSMVGKLAISERISCAYADKRLNILEVE